MYLGSSLESEPATQVSHGSVKFPMLEPCWSYAGTVLELCQSRRPIMVKGIDMFSSDARDDSKRH